MIDETILYDHENDSKQMTVDEIVAKQMYLLEIREHNSIAEEFMPNKSYSYKNHSVDQISQETVDKIIYKIDPKLKELANNPS